MATFTNIILLPEEDYQTLKTNGTITKGGVTLNFDPTAFYFTDRISADMIDDTNCDNKIPTSAQITAWNSKVDASELKTINNISLIKSGADTNINVSAPIQSIYVNSEEVTPSSGRVDLTVPTAMSDLSNDAGFVTQSYVDSHAGKIDKVYVNWVEQTITNREINIVTPSKTSELQNDLNYVTNTYTPAGVTATTGAGGTTTLKFWSGTQQQYDAITTKDPTTMYVISNS